MKNVILGCCLFVGLFCMVSCDSDSESNARVEVWLTDDPGDYDEVNVEIDGVEIHAAEEDEGGWQPLNVNVGVINLLALTNGLDTLLGTVEIPSGKISQIRLKLGSNNTVTVGGQTYDLEVPSGQQSGLKLQVHETIAAGVTYKILLDFDVARSVVQTGTGQFKLKPVIRTITEATTGAIKGEVSPKESTPAIYAVAERDTLATTFSDSTGHFLLRGIPEGTYDVLFSPSSDYEGTEKKEVKVETGIVTDLGLVTIEEN